MPASLKERFQKQDSLRKTPPDWKKAVKVDRSKEDPIVDWLKQFGYDIDSLRIRWGSNREPVICGESIVAYIMRDDYLFVRYACFQKHGYWIYGGKRTPLVALTGLFGKDTGAGLDDASQTFWSSVPFIGLPESKHIKLAKKGKRLGEISTGHSGTKRN